MERRNWAVSFSLIALMMLVTSCGGGGGGGRLSEKYRQVRSRAGEKRA
jgi:hypothetical protein